MVWVLSASGVVCLIAFRGIPADSLAICIEFIQGFVENGTDVISVFIDFLGITNLLASILVA